MLFDRSGLRPFLTVWASLCMAAMGCTSLAADLPPSALQALRQANVPPSAISVQVTPLGSATPRLAHRAQVSSNPASVMKLITTYAGLSLLGPDFTWRNRV